MSLAEERERRRAEAFRDDAIALVAGKPTRLDIIKAREADRAKKIISSKAIVDRHYPGDIDDMIAHIKTIILEKHKSLEALIKKERSHGIRLKNILDLEDLLSPPMNDDKLKTITQIYMKDKQRSYRSVEGNYGKIMPNFFFLCIKKNS